MNQSETTNIINHFYDLLSKEELNKNERFFIEHIELELTKSILQDFGEVIAKRLALVLLGSINDSKKVKKGHFYCSTTASTGAYKDYGIIQTYC